MKISFHGAARTVTGSKHLITLRSGTQILLDCGLFQGMGKQTMALNMEWGFDPQKVTYMVLSHAHIDHVGLLPKLIKDGYKGKIFCTSATADMARILMLDSARIQESDVAHINDKREREGKPPIVALYTEEDAVAAYDLMYTVPYNKPFGIDENIELTLTDVGHILGSAAANLKIKEDGRTTRLTFSGDVGQYRHAILRSPQGFPQADYIIMESTYGDKLHGISKPAADELRRYIIHTCIDKGGKLVIPAFAVGRTQEILFQLNRLSLERRLPDVKYYVDSPLAIDATEVIRHHPECFNKTVKELLEIDDDVFAFDGLEYIRTPEDSIALKESDEPCVIISASGMAEAGRVKHHIAYTVDDRKNTILIVGYCDARSLGGQLRDGAREVFIFGDHHEVHAEVGVIESLSAHGDYDDLFEWLSSQDVAEVKQLFLVHGEYPVQEAFRERLLRKGYKNVIIPDLHEEVEL